MSLSLNGKASEVCMDGKKLSDIELASLGEQ
jgi:hypothetical protein